MAAREGMEWGVINVERARLEQAMNDLRKPSAKWEQRASIVYVVCKQSAIFFREQHGAKGKPSVYRKVRVLAFLTLHSFAAPSKGQHTNRRVVSEPLQIIKKNIQLKLIQTKGVQALCDLPQ